MNIQHFRTLVAVRDHARFLDAADTLALTPAAVSQQMRLLEDQLGAELFDRSVRPPRLNAHGERVVAEARDVLARYDALIEMARAEGAIAGTLTLGSASGITSTLIAKALAQLRARHPRLQVRIEEGLTTSLIARLRRRDLDAAIITAPSVPESDMKTLPVISEAMIVVAPPDTVAADADWRAVLTSAPFLRLNRQSGIGILIDETLRRAGISVDDAMELDNSDSIVDMVAEGLGVGVVPAGRLRGIDPGLVAQFPFGAPPVRRKVVLMERAHNPRSDLATIFYQELLALSDGTASG